MSDTKTKIGYGLKENVTSALESQKLDAYDIIFTSNPGKEQIGFVKPDGTVAYMKANALNELFNSYEEAEAYISSSDAYEGQTIKVKSEDGKYHSYIIQPSESGTENEFVLEEYDGVSLSDLKQYVIVGQRPSEDQEQGIIYIEGKAGYIWNGSDWVKIFEIDELEEALEGKAPLENPAFTGSVTIDGDEVATKEWVDALIEQLHMGIPGIVDDGENPLPSEGYIAGETWRVTVGGTYAGQVCEVGDLIICLKAYDTASASNSDFMVVQANITGSVTGPDTAISGNIAVYDGSTGKIIKDSNVNIASLNTAIANSHTHANKNILDTYDQTQTELIDSVKSDFEDRIGAIPSETTLKEYIDTSISNSETSIEQAKQEAIEAAKAYVDASLTITEF